MNTETDTVAQIPAIEITEASVIIDGIKLARQPEKNGAAPELPAESVDSSRLGTSRSLIRERLFTSAESPAKVNLVTKSSLSIEPELTRILQRVLKARTGQLSALPKTGVLEPVELALFEYLARIDLTTLSAEGTADSLEPSVLISTLGLPAATIRAASASLETKLASEAPNARPTLKRRR